jgi:hypothetical protein
MIRDLAARPSHSRHSPHSDAAISPAEISPSGNHLAVTKSRKKFNSNGANFGFKKKLWAAADKLRGHMDAAQYRDVILGLVCLK